MNLPELPPAARSLPQHWSTWGNYSPHDRALLLKAYFLLNALRLGLWGLKFPQLLQLAARLGSQSHSAPQRPSVARLMWAVNAAALYCPGQPRCLAKALTAHILMRRHDYAPQLRIGVAKSADLAEPAANSTELEAHAWVTYQDYVVMGDQVDLNKYHCLPSLQVFGGLS
jgi:hypothetical protein